MANRSDLDVHINGHDNLTPNLDKSASSVIRWVGAVTSALAAIEALSFPVRAIREFEREMANVTKTTGFSAAEIAKLGTSLKRMSTQIDISATDLAKIAAAAGQQGLGREGVEGVTAFTETVARMSSVLDISVEEAGAAVGKLTSIFKVPLTQVENMSSAFNEVANNSTATGDQLIDVVRRVGDAAGAFRDYSEALGFAATAVDFGVSPEVAGTSLTKIFADMQGKAEKFSEFMGKSTLEWIDMVRTNGVGAFQAYLAKLRTLNGGEQQRMIRELSGTGRIGALLTKFVNDTTDSLLKRNLDNAKRGMEGGISAIREQLTVMNTVDAQAKILSNTFNNLGIAAGEQFAKPLASYLARLSDTLSGEDFTRFAEAVGKSFLRIIESVAAVAEYVGGLNVNWENLINIGTVLLGLKIADWITTLVGRLTGLSAGLRQVTANARETSQALAEASRGSSTAGATAGAAAAVSGYKAQKQSLQELIEARRRYTAALEQQARAERNLKSAEAARDAARRKYDNMYEAQQTSFQALRPLEQNLRTSQQQAAAAQAAIGTAVAQTQARLQASIETKTAAHNQRLSELQRAHETRLAALRGQEHERARRQLREAHNAELAALEATHARSLAATRGYWARQTEIARQGAMATAAAAQAAANAAANDLQRAAGALGTEARAAELATAAAGVERLNRQVAEAAQKVSVADKAVKALSVGLTGLRAAAMFAYQAFNFLLSAISRFFAIGSIVFMFMEMFGIIDKLPDPLLKVANMLGFYSRAQKEGQVATEKANAAIKTQTQLFREQYDALKDVTGGIGKERIDLFKGMLTSGGPDVVREAQEGIIAALQGAYAQIKEETERLEAAPMRVEKLSAELKKKEEMYATSAARVAALSQKLGADAIRAELSDPFYGLGVSKHPLMRQLVAAKAETDDLRRAIRGIGRELELAGNTEAIQRAIEKAKGDAEEMKKLVAGMFTDTSAEVFLKYQEKIAAAYEKVNKTREEAQRLADSEIGSRTKETEEVEKLARASNVAFQEFEKANLERAKLSEEITQELDRLAKQEGVSEQTLNSIALVRKMLGEPLENGNVLVDTLRALISVGTSLSGSLAPQRAPDSTGSGVGTGGEGDARRLAKARLKLLAEERKAAAKLDEEANAERLRALEYSNDQGLVAMREYFRRKQEIQLQDNARAIELAEEEMKGIMDEYKHASGEVEKLQAKASLVRAQGEIDALKQARGFILTQIARDLQDAQRELVTTIATNTLNVSDLLGGVSDIEVYKAHLDIYNEEYRKLINRMEAEAKEMPELLPLVEKLKQAPLAAAGAAAIESYTRTLDVATSGLDQTIRRFEILGQQGVMNTILVEQATDKLRAAQIKQIQATILQAETILEKIPQGTLEYDRQTQAIEGMRLRIMELTLASNETARGINEGITNSLSDMLTKFDGTLSSMRDAARSFALDVAQQVQKVLADSVAKSLMTALNGKDGSGGVGGLVTSLAGGAFSFGGGSWGKDSKVNQNPGVELFKIAEQTTSSAASAIAESGIRVSDMFTSSADLLSDDILEGFWGLFSKLGSGLSSVFSDLFSSLSSGSGGGLFGSIGSFFTNLFHSGGKVGAGGGMRRAVSPLLFANAARYHTGAAMLGLKPDELPAILRKGETVLTPEQLAEQRRLGDGTGEARPVNVWVVTPDQQAGMTPDDVIVTVADNIARGGSIKKLIKTVR